MCIHVHAETEELPKFVFLIFVFERLVDLYFSDHIYQTTRRANKSTIIVTL